jgi:hypothetical protein
VCGHGTPYSFFFKVGTNDRVTVFFEGGGACWDAGSCMIPGLWTDSVDIDQNLSDLSSREGLLSDDPRSPIYNDTVLYLPYCTVPILIRGFSLQRWRLICILSNSGRCSHGHQVEFVPDRSRRTHQR